MRHVEQLKLSRNLARRARAVLESIDLSEVPDPAARAKVLGLSVQAEMFEQRLEDALSLLEA